MKDLIEKFWVTKEGYPAVVRFSPIGYRLGYVGVPKEHNLYGKTYLGLNINCYWGLTYPRKQISTKQSYCYPTKDKQYNSYWFFGFDAGHKNDAPDIEAFKKLYGETEMLIPCSARGTIRGTIKTLDFMIDECNDMSKQLKEME